MPWANVCPTVHPLIQPPHLLLDQALQEERKHADDIYALYGLLPTKPYATGVVLLHGNGEVAALVQLPEPRGLGPHGVLVRHPPRSGGLGRLLGTRSRPRDQAAGSLAQETPRIRGRGDDRLE